MTINSPVISVVIPLFNKEHFVARALRSVIAQSFSNYEIIVVNDGSSDKGPEVVSSINDGRIRMLHQDNKGASVARNVGIHESKADIIAFLDADDEWESDYLKTIVHLKNAFPQCHVYATSYFLRKHESRQKAILNNMPDNFTEGVMKNYFIVAAHSDPPLWTSAVAVTKSAIEAIGGFPEGVCSGEDLLTWARLASKYDIAYCALPKAHFWTPLRVSDRPGRVPQHPDTVGNSLRDLLNSVDPAIIPGLKAYIALWHRMRAVIYIQLGARTNALKEIREAIGFFPSPRLFLLLLIASLPGSLPSRVLMSIKRVKAFF